jgi:hypothetical protein
MRWSAFTRLAAVDEYSPRTIGLTLAEGKLVLAGLQHHLVQAQTEDHCRRRRRCQRCGAPRPIKDKRSRRPLSRLCAAYLDTPHVAKARQGNGMILDRLLCAAFTKEYAHREGSKRGKENPKCSPGAKRRQS